MKSAILTLITLLASVSAYAWPIDNGPFAFALDCQEVGPRNSGIAMNYSIAVSGRKNQGVGSLSITGFQTDNELNIRGTFNSTRTQMTVYSANSNREVLAHVVKTKNGATLVFDGTLTSLSGKKGSKVSCEFVPVGE